MKWKKYQSHQIWIYQKIFYLDLEHLQTIVLEIVLLKEDLSRNLEDFFVQKLKQVLLINIKN